MIKVDLTEIIKGVKQPTFDDEMIARLIEGLYEKSFYSYVRMQNAINDFEKIDRKAEQDLWHKKAPGKQGNDFTHMGNTGDIGYCSTRLYINCSKRHLMTFANLFTEKCIEQKLPVYFKYLTNDQRTRADTIVIYSNIHNLSDYIAVLQEIAQENPDLIKQCGNPPLLAGRIDEWIGIGDEPAIRNFSYTMFRANIIQNVLRRVIPSAPMNEWDKFQTLDLQNADFDLIRKELRKAFEEHGIRIDTFAFNNENLQLYMSDEQTRKAYSQRRVEQKENNEERKSDYREEYLAINELKILKQIGGMPETIDIMIAATLQRYGVITDLYGNIGLFATSNMLEYKFGLPAFTVLSGEYKIQFQTPKGKIDMSYEEQQRVSKLIESDLTLYYTKYFAKEQAILEQTLSRYSELLKIPAGQSKDLDIEKADLASKLSVLAKGKEFFRAIGIHEDTLDTVCNRVQNFFQEIEQSDNKQPSTNENDINSLRSINNDYPESVLTTKDTSYRIGTINAVEEYIIANVQPDKVLSNGEDEKRDEP